MKKVVVFISDGTEEIEVVTPIDVLRRAGVECDIVSVCETTVRGSHGIKIIADKLVCDINFDDYDGVVIPGGMPGATIISENPYAINGIKKMIESGKIVGAICASPAVVLGTHNLLGAHKATCYPAPDFIQIIQNNYTGEDVEISENLVTANGPRSALKFALALCEKLNVTPKI